MTSSIGSANTSHAGWPPIDGMLLVNKTDQDRPLDARPGEDPFDGADPVYSCDAVHKLGGCQHVLSGCETVGRRLCAAGSVTVAPAIVHNELLGGHGNDSIHAGPHGDVIWGDYKATGQPTHQVDLLVGGAGKDFIYAGHGINTIDGGGGPDHIKAHFGQGTIDCGAGRDILYISRKALKHYKVTNCETITFRTLGY